MFEKITMKLFGDLTEPYLGYFENLNVSLKKAGLEKTLHEYLCSVVFYSLIVFLITVPLNSVFITMLLGDSIYSYTLGIILAMVFSGIVFFIGYYYPNILAKSIELEFCVENVRQVIQSPCSILIVFPTVSVGLIWLASF